MCSNPYTNWTKQKVTSWEDLLVSEFKGNTIVYIDNLFDGFMYRQNLDHWFDSLCNFYFEFIEPVKNIRLIITAKKHVMEKACLFTKSETLSLFKTCTIDEFFFPLTFDEKMKILDHQIQLAQELKGIDVPFTTETEKLKTELQNKMGPLGFPLCAHMYAFEKNLPFRNACIFDNPRGYVLNHVHQEIESDKTDGVKTLFLFLIFYHSSKTEKISEDLDLKYGRECRAFLQAKCSKILIEKMEPLSFENLNEKACELEDTVLIKHYTMFEFKHQIYLEGVSEYFFRKYFDAVVDHFPLDILREYQMHDNSADKVDKLVRRLKEEIMKNSNPEALKWKVWNESKFKEEFCKSLQNESPLIAVMMKNQVLSFQLYFDSEDGIHTIHTFTP